MSALASRKRRAESSVSRSSEFQDLCSGSLSITQECIFPTGVDSKIEPFASLPELRPGACHRLRRKARS
ncbi:MAG: hypothetical protein MI923_25295 [Phycisphaerales bacterium]|nr:hypothetical protein [Phycisphaerales bacterium]